MSIRVVAANFDQLHQNTNVRWMYEHPEIDLVGVCDEDQSTSTGSLPSIVSELSLPESMVYADLDAMLNETAPDVIVGCPMNAEHATFVDRVVSYDAHIAIEKPFAMTLDDADRMLKTMDGVDTHLLINWPSMWSPVIHEIKRIIDAGTIGDILEIQYYQGNYGVPPNDSWFYEAAAGGGSLLDFLCYGVTFGTWFRNGDLPVEVAAHSHVPAGAEVDNQSVTVCRYEQGLSTFQTSWQMFDHRSGHSRPSRGYEIIGTEGAISTRDVSSPLVLQTADDPAGEEIEPAPLSEEFTNLAGYLVALLGEDITPTGPVDPTFCRKGQQILDTARASIEAGTPLALLE